MIYDAGSYIGLERCQDNLPNAIIPNAKIPNAIIPNANIPNAIIPNVP